MEFKIQWLIKSKRGRFSNASSHFYRNSRIKAKKLGTRRQKSPRPGKKTSNNYAQRLLSANKREQNVAKINVDAITQAPSTSTMIICRNCLSYGTPAPHDHSTIKCTKDQQIFCYKCSRVGYRTPDCPTPECKASKKPPGNAKRVQR